MGNEKDYIRYDGGKEKTVQEAVDEFLDEEAETIIDKIDKSQAGSIGQMNIKMVSEEITPLDSPVEPMLLLGIAKLDNKHYGAIFRLISHKAAIEELHVNATLTEIKSSRLIEDPTEWSVLSKFFMDNHVFEMNRIINWAFSCMANDKKSLIESIKRLPWLDKVNRNLKAKYKRPLTPEEIAVEAIKRNWPNQSKKKKGR